MAVFVLAAFAASVSLVDDSLVADRMAGHGLTNWGSASPRFDDCDYGGTMTTPLLAWDLSQSTSSFPWVQYSDRAARVTPVANAHIRCASTDLSTFPKCGLETATGGPDGGAWIDLDLGVGALNTQRGLQKEATDNLEVDITTDATFAIWVKRDATSLRTEIFAKTADYRMGGIVLADDEICIDHSLAAGDDCGSGSLNGMGDFPIDYEWTHWTFVFEDGATDSKDYRVYKNGTVLGTRAVDPINFGTSIYTLQIGATNIYTRLYGGIAHPQVWDAALSDAEITLLQTCGVPTS
jgi:hypothetical protein